MPNGKPQERSRFSALRSKTLAFKKRIAINFCDLKTSLGARTCVQVLCVQKTRRFAFAFLSPVISAYPALNPLVSGILSCLRRSCRSRDSRRFREDHRFGKP